MYNYFKGIITNIEFNCITIEINGIGYRIFTPNPYLFKEGNVETIYLYNHIREEENSLYGFKTEEERQMFLEDLGLKTSGLARNRENILYLTKFPKIGEKLARQIILDLKGKLVSLDKEEIKSNEELVLVLESLGYKNADIKKVITQVNNSIPLEDQVKEALKLLLK